MRQQRRRVAATVAVGALLATGFTVASTTVAAADVTECGPSVQRDAAEGTWTLANEGISKELTLSADGRFQQTALTNLVSGRELMSPSAPAPEFQIAESSPRVEHQGSSPGWELVEDACTTVDVDGDGVIDRADLRITVENARFRVDANYSVWAGESAIEQHFAYTNISGGDLVVSDPLVLNHTALTDSFAAGDAEVTYFTGGYNSPNSLKPHTVVPGPGWVLDLQTQYVGSLDYLPEVIVRDVQHDDGLLTGWSYTGSTFTRMTSSGSIIVDAYGANGLTIAADETWTMGTAHLVAFAGDLDDAGNMYKNFQYRHKWDLTNDDWVAAAKPYNFPAPWNTDLGSFTNEGLFDMVQGWRAIGADINHLDAGWHGKEGNINHTGDWVNSTGADLGELGSFSAKNEMGYMVWLPPWDASPDSAVYQDNPDWRVTRDVHSFCEWGAGSLRMDNDDAVAWMLDLLNEKSDEFGPWIWRQDMGGLSFDGWGVNPIHANENFYQLMADFREANPEAGVNVNMCGGNILNLASVHNSDLVQVTDGAPGQWSSWTPSFLYPQDKFWGWDFGPDQTAIVAQMQRGMEWNGWTLLKDPGGTQLWTKYVDIMQFMKANEFAGRWSQLYHPEVVGEEQIYFVQRMNSDNTAGVIVPARDNFVEDGVTVYPKGLDPELDYSVTFQNSLATSTKTGAEWMADGITAQNWGGDLVWLNVTDFPGAQTDTTPPAAPTEVTATPATEMGFEGIAVTWTHAVDDNWVSKYEVLKDGVVVATSGKAAYAFIEGGDAEAEYTVRAVDGDGNQSPLAEVVSTTASSDFTREQGGRGWSYEAHEAGGVTPLTWDERTSRWSAPGYLTIGDAWQHPSMTADSVRVWTSHVDGAGEILPSRISVGSPGGDGVRVRVLVDDVQVWPETGWVTVPSGEAIETPLIETALEEGSRVSFVVNRGTTIAFDSVAWDPSIRWTLADSGEEPGTGEPGTGEPGTGGPGTGGPGTGEPGTGGPGTGGSGTGGSDSAGAGSSPASSTGALASTGFDGTLLSALAFAVLALGALLTTVVLRRRRTLG
ncbi:hypothetical protein [Agromyces silvae]|uniref:hypothetical protein n=1 Tax=Agromyces silvae TaxID=3388266 RepID=UPI00280A8619|nr:hypothetical protein [Agromyces protaetiae]